MGVIAILDKLRIIEKWQDMLVDLVFPRRCPICSEIVMPKGKLICPDCRKQLAFIKEPVCKQCGKMLTAAEKEYCEDCIKINHSFNGGWALLNYDTYMQSSIARFKYHNKREFKSWYGEELLAKYERTIQRIQPDYIIPVPLHKTKQRRRGYNQAGLLAKELAKGTGIPLAAGILVRQRKTKPLKDMNPRERRQALKGAFAVTGDLSAINTVLLVDDIYTTGSTIDACSKVLKAAGVKKVYYISICIGNG